MRFVVAGAAVALLLAGCGGSDEPGESASASPTESESPADEVDYAAVCDGFGAAVALPSDDAIEYTVTYNEPTGWATNASICDIEPDGDYFDVATEFGEFGRADLNLGVLTEEQIQESGFPEYKPESVQDLLALEQAEPGNIDREEPCETEDCEDFVPSYMYSYRFETVMDDVAVIAQFDYITTDVSGEQQAEYRGQAVAAFTASMEEITAHLQ